MLFLQDTPSIEFLQCHYLIRPKFGCFVPVLRFHKTSEHLGFANSRGNMSARSNKI